MTGYPAISGINYGYGLDSISSDPYWQKYWMMSQQMDSVTNAQRQSANAAALQNSPVFQAAPQDSLTTQPTNVGMPQVEEKKSASTALATTLLLGTTAIGTACWLASRGRSAGAKGLWNQIKTGFKSFGKGSTKVAPKFQARQLENGKWVISLPDKARVFKGTEIATNKDSLGIAVNEGLKWTDDLAMIKGYNLEIKGADNTIKRITYRNGEVISCVDLSKSLTDSTRNLTEAYRNGSIDEALKSQIDDAIKAINSKDVTKLPSNISLKNIAYTQEMDGAQALFAANVETKFGTNGIKLLKTNRYPLESDQVWAERTGEFKDAILALTNAKKPVYDAWQVGVGTYNPKIKGWPSAASIKIKDNQIVGISENGVFHDTNSVRYRSLYNQYQSTFDDAFKHQGEFKDVVWDRAA